MEVVHILVEHGACIDKLNIALLNPLDIAAENNNLEVMSSIELQHLFPSPSPFYLLGCFSVLGKTAMGSRVAWEGTA